MIVTVEISLYPLRQDYEVIIIDFIKSLNEHEGLWVRTNAMSTHVKGEWALVMDVLKKELGTVYDKIDTSSTVIKIINDNLEIERGELKF